MSDLTPANRGHRIDLLTLRVVRNAADLEGMKAALLTAAAEFGFEVTRLNLHGTSEAAPTLEVIIERKDGVAFEFDVPLSAVPHYIGLYVKGGALAYAAELDASMIAMLETPQTVVAREAPRKGLILPGSN